MVMVDRQKVDGMVPPYISIDRVIEQVMDVGGTWGVSGMVKIVKPHVYHVRLAL